MCFYKQDSEDDMGPIHAKILNMSVFSIYERLLHSILNMPKCILIVLNISWVLNMPGFWIWQGSENGSVTQSSRYITMWLNMSE